MGMDENPTEAGWIDAALENRDGQEGIILANCGRRGQAIILSVRWADGTEEKISDIGIIRK